MAPRCAKVSSGPSSLAVLGPLLASRPWVFGGPSPRLALRVPWSLFLEYWDDFLYPSDDTAVLIPSFSLVLLYADEHLTRVDAES